MWALLTDKSQLAVSGRLRKTLDEGNFTHRTIYRITQVGKTIFSAQAIEHNDVEIPENDQMVYQFSTEPRTGIIDHGFEFWID